MPQAPILLYQDTTQNLRRVIGMIQILHNNWFKWSTSTSARVIQTFIDE